MQAAKKLRQASRVAQTKLDGTISASRDLDFSLRNLVFLVMSNGWRFTGLLALVLYLVTISICALMALAIPLENSLANAQLEVGIPTAIDLG